MLKNRTVANAGWLIGCRIVQSLLGFIVSMFTARYLGPSNYGTISYAASLVAFVVPIMSLGFTSILVQEIIGRPEKEGETLGTAIGLALVSGGCCIIGIISFVCITSANERDTIIVCALYSLSLIAQAIEIIQYWFQAQLLARHTAIVSLMAYVVISVYKIFLLITEKSIYWFAVSNTLDYAIIAVTLLAIYKKKGKQRLSFSWSRARQMLPISKYYIISNMMVVVFSQTDRIMLKHMIGETATGFYAAAVTCAGITSFVFSAIIDSARPTIFSAKERNQEQFELNMRRLYAVIIYLALAQSAVIAVFSGLLVKVIYGTAYAPAADVFSVLVWYTTFSYLGSVRNIWILAEGRQQLLWKINLSGALMNVFLNLLLIPMWSVVGAAAASLVTQIFTNLIVGYLMKPIRSNNKLMAESLHPKYIFGMLSQIRNR